MSIKEERDFLDAIDREYSGLDDFTQYIKNEVDIQDINGNLSIIGSIRDFGSNKEFTDSLGRHFEVMDRSGDLMLLWSGNKGISHYVYLNGEFPIFFTTARKTEDLPETIWNYLREEKEMSRMWIAKRQMENLRKNIVREHPEVIIPYFTGNRSRYSDVEAERRPGYKRTIQYYGKDGLSTFKEMKYQYGILPTNLQFEKANAFKFRVKQSGIFTINKAGIPEVLDIIKDSIDRLSAIKKIIDTSDFDERENNFADGNLTHSKPWGVEALGGISENDIDHFEDKIELDEWEFALSRFTPSVEETGFDAELIDEYNYGETSIKTKEDVIRVYPRKTTGIDQSVRIYNFVNDHIDPNCEPVQIV